MKWTAIIAFGLIVSACTSLPSGVDGNTTSEANATTTTISEPGMPVVTMIDEGGCFMAGPNCATYVVYSDGTIEVLRTGEPDTVEATTGVDAALAATIRDLVATTDLEALRSGLPEGEMTAAYDGVDTTFIFHTTGGDVTFSSAVVELVESEPLFAATWKVRRLAAASAELPMQTRP